MIIAQLWLRFFAHFWVLVPQVTSSSFTFNPINHTLVSFDLIDPNSVHFDNGTLQAFNSEHNNLVYEVLFSRADFPVEVGNVPCGNVYNFTFSLSVGTDVDCGDEGIVSMQPISFLLDPHCE